MANPSAAGRDQRDASSRPTVTLEELAAAQRVGPAIDLDALSAFWPADDDPDALDAFIADERAARRRVASGRPPHR